MVVGPTSNNRVELLYQRLGGLPNGAIGPKRTFFPARKSSRFGIVIDSSARHVPDRLCRLARQRLGRNHLVGSCLRSVGLRSTRINLNRFGKAKGSILPFAMDAFYCSIGTISRTAQNSWPNWNNDYQPHMEG
jgi:hypothetical protein